MRRILIHSIGLCLFALPASGAETVRRVDERFASPEAAEVPDFRRHVVPLLGRLGCNGRACHGSFQGQGGFRLSLFGYDFKADHEALTGGDSPRADRKSPEDSLMLLKPTLTVSHKGGKRMEAGGWQYRLLLRWIQAGAPGVQDGDPSFASLEVEPKEIVFSRPGQAVQIKITAHWSDGSREDVTPLCRFRSNDEATVTVNDSGLVMAAGRGDTDVVAFYDNGLVTVPVM